MLLSYMEEKKSEIQNLTTKLRNITNISMIECKKALELSGLDLEKAKTYLYTEYADKIAKKKENNSTENAMIFVKKKSDQEIRYICLKTETDSLFGNSVYQECGNSILDSSHPKSVINTYIARIGENIKCDQVEKIQGKNLYYYIHSNYDNNMGLYLGVVDLNENKEGNFLAQQVVGAATDNLEDFLNYEYKENESIREFIKNNNISINNIYLIKTK